MTALLGACTIDLGARAMTQCASQAVSGADGTLAGTIVNNYAVHKHACGVAAGVEAEAADAGYSIESGY